MKDFSKITKMRIAKNQTIEKIFLNAQRVDVDKYKSIALERLFPIKPVDENTETKKDFLFSATRSDAGRHLPDYYLVYFLFSDLLGFKNLGKFDKVAWSFPIDFNGKAFLIEY